MYGTLLFPLTPKLDIHPPPRYKESVMKPTTKYQIVRNYTSEYSKMSPSCMIYENPLDALNALKISETAVDYIYKVETSSYGNVYITEISLKEFFDIAQLAFNAKRNIFLPPELTLKATEENINSLSK